MIWQTKKLGEICDFQRGLTYSKKDEVDFSESVVLRSNNIELISSSLNLDELRYINNKILIPDNKKVKKGSIIICTANGSKSHLGKIALIDKDYGYAFGGFMGQLIPRNEINSKYFFYILTSDLYKKHLAKISSGANINNLKFSDLSEFQIPLPPLPEQHRIVKILDDVFEKTAKAKANAEKNLTNAKELFDNYLYSIFTNNSRGWKFKKLSEVAEYFNGLTYSPKDVSNKGIIVLRSSNVQNDELDFSDIVKVNKIVKDKIIVHDGDILMCSRNGSKRLVGKTATIGNLKEKMTFGTFMMIVRSNQNSYLKWFFKSSEFRRQITSGENTMINQITRYMLDDVIISFPPSGKQKSIVAKLDELSDETKKLEAIYRQKLADLEELKKSVLKKAFVGEL